MKRVFFILIFLIIGDLAYSIESNSLPPKGERVFVKAGFGYTLRELKDGGEKDYDSLQLLFTLGFNPFDHLSIYARSGMSDMHLRGSDRTPMDLTLGGGVTVSLLDPDEPNNILIDAGIDYFTPGDYRIIDYQFGATYIYRTRVVIPYAGIKFSDINLKNTVNNYEYQGKWKFGIVIGIQYFVNPNVFFSTEMHNFDQDSVYGSAGFLF